MAKQIKYVKVKDDWWGKIKEKHLAKVISENQREGWVYEGVEDHGSFINKSWVAKFSRGKE